MAELHFNFDLFSDAPLAGGLSEAAPFLALPEFGFSSAASRSDYTNAYALANKLAAVCDDSMPAFKRARFGGGGGGGDDDDDEFGIPPLEYVNDEAPEKSSIAALGSSGVKDVVDLVSAIGVKSAKIARALLCLMFLVFISNATNK